MLKLYNRNGLLDTLPEKLPADVVWIDLREPEPDELTFIQEATGLRIPTHAELSEIERSSRLAPSAWKNGWPA